MWTLKLGVNLYQFPLDDFLSIDIYFTKKLEKLFHWANIPDEVKSESNFSGNASINLKPSLAG